MRVLFDADERIHAWLPVGHFTIGADGEVAWHTEYSPLAEHAKSADDSDVLVLDRFEARLSELTQAGGELHDALYLRDSHRLAALCAREDADVVRLIVSEPGSGQVDFDMELKSDPPRLPGFGEQEVWREEATVEPGYHRGTRLGPARNGIAVTCNTTGHVLVVDVESGALRHEFRVPSAPENTVYATETDDGLIVGVKFNHRHSEIYHVSSDGELLGQWPPQDEEDPVRWGMPEPVVVSDHVVTYSDEGPHRKSLHLLELPSLEEVDYEPMGHWPAAADAFDDVFVVVSKHDVVVGTVSDGRFDIENRWSTKELRRMAGVGLEERPSTATSDGRGTRIWLEEQVDFFGVDEAPVVMTHETGEVAALEREGDATVNRDVILPGEPRKDEGAGLFGWAPRRKVFDVSNGKLAVQASGRIQVVDVSTGDVTLTSHEARDVPTAKILPGGVFYAEIERVDFDDNFVWKWCDGDDTSEISRSLRRTGASTPDIVFDGERWCWVEYRVDDGEAIYQLVTWEPGAADPTRVNVDAKVLLLAAAEDARYVVTEGRTDDPEGYGSRLVQRLLADGTLERVSAEPFPSFVRELAVAPNAAFAIEPPTSSNEGPDPSKLHRVDLRTGELDTLAEATIGAFSHLQLTDDALWWLESPDSSMRFFDQGEAEELSVVYRLSV